MTDDMQRVIAESLELILRVLSQDVIIDGYEVVVDQQLAKVRNIFHKELRTSTQRSSS